MYLFSRQVTLQGPFREIGAWAAEITGVINAHSEVPVTLWSSSMGNPVGSMAWSARVDSHAQLDAVTQSLQTNDAYMDLADQGQQYISEPGEDFLRQFVTEPGAEPPQVAMITTAVAANGKMAEAIEFGVGMAEHVTKATGHPLALLTDAYGTFGSLTWINGFPDMAAVDSAQDALMADEEYLNRIVKAGDLFVEGSGQRSLAQRIV
ncbi:MAG: hypothetical protein ACR2QE_09450 [Acidimicrobiales bacterium]